VALDILGIIVLLVFLFSKRERIEYQYLSVPKDEAAVALPALSLEAMNDMDTHCTSLRFVISSIISVMSDVFEVLPGQSNQPSL
jgi:hypothetical protein